MPATDEMFTIEPPAYRLHGGDGVLGAEKNTAGLTDRHDSIRNFRPQVIEAKLRNTFPSSRISVSPPRPPSTCWR
jgi:hypothetical protein